MKKRKRTWGGREETIPPPINPAPRKTPKLPLSAHGGPKPPFPRNAIAHVMPCKRGIISQRRGVEKKNAGEKSKMQRCQKPKARYVLVLERPRSSLIRGRFGRSCSSNPPPAAFLSSLNHRPDVPDGWSRRTSCVHVEGLYVYAIFLGSHVAPSPCPAMGSSSVFSLSLSSSSLGRWRKRCTCRGSRIVFQCRLVWVGERVGECADHHPFSQGARAHECGTAQHQRPNTHPQP